MIGKKKTQILLTGVAGFIGAHTLEHILENTDWDIVGIDSLAHRGDLRRIEQVMAKNPEWRKRLWFLKFDLAFTMPAHLVLNRLFTKKPRFDYIINMASESHVDRSIAVPPPFVRNNFDLTINMLEWARIIKPKKFIQISTDEVYGPMINDRPFKEWDAELPSNPYSASKAAQEMIAISYWRTFGVPLIITNTINNFGEMQDAEKFVPMLIRDIVAGKPAQIHGTKEYIGTRYYLHARNHADALLFILKNGRVRPYDPRHRFPARYNITGNVRLNNLDMATQIARILDRPLKYKLIDFHKTRPGHDLDYGLNGDKLRRLGWSAPLLFEDALQNTVRNYIEHPEWLK